MEMKIRAPKTRYALMARGKYGVYDGQYGDKHRIIEGHTHWPFPTTHLLDSSEFKLFRHFEKTESPEEQSLL